MLSKNSDIAVFIVVTTGLILLLISFIILILFLYKRRQGVLLRGLEMQRLDYEKKLLAIQIEIQEQVANRISQEIHDNINSLLGLARLHLYDMPREGSADMQQKLDNTINYVSRAIEDLRYLSGTLNGDYINQVGLQSAIEQELEYLGRLKLFTTRLVLDGIPVFLKDNKREVMIFRIVQEALSNCIKHAAGATQLVVTMQYSATQLHIAVCDDGKSWKEESARGPHKKGMGLKNMEQRALLLKGSFRIAHSPTHGTTVNLSIPL